MHRDGYYDYASFGERVVAYLIDGFILIACAGVVMLILGGALFGSIGFGLAGSNETMGDAMLFAGVLMYFLYIIGMAVGAWLYFALQESSPRMATIGKRVMGIVVTDMEGHRLSFSRASGRFFGKWISSAIMYVGFIMVAFTDRKQALHDMIANSLVMKDH